VNDRFYLCYFCLCSDLVGGKYNVFYLIIMKRILWFILSTFIFTLWFLFIRSYFFWWDELEHIHYIEETYIDAREEEEDFEQWYINQVDLETLKEKQEAIKKKLKAKFSQQTIIEFHYFPWGFKNKVSAYRDTLKNFLESDPMKSKIRTLNIHMNEKLFDVRWKMKNRVLHFFWVLWMEQGEFLSVWIHEFAHYVDLYFLKKSVLRDISDYFYSISWDSAKVMKSWGIQKHFVSGYAMTNKYEDFAESFTYYILHNDDFLEKSQESEVLREKYDFFTKNLFKQNEFIWTDFSSNEKVENYYWDITKIEFHLQKLLIFLEKGI